jgi:carbon storage regulator CsrA
MLVLTRKVEEKIQIGPNITLTIVRIKGHSVQIGIEAPDQVRVLRGELAAAEDLRAEGSEFSHGGLPELPKPGTPEPARDKSEPKAECSMGHGRIGSQELGRRAPRCFFPPHEPCLSGAGDLVDLHQLQAESVGQLALAWR